MAERQSVLNRMKTVRALMRQLIEGPEQVDSPAKAQALLEEYAALDRRLTDLPENEMNEWVRIPRVRARMHRMTATIWAPEREAQRLSEHTATLRRDAFHPWR